MTLLRTSLAAATLLAGTAACLAPAWAGADDGGSKAFFGVTSPGSSNYTLSGPPQPSLSDRSSEYRAYANATSMIYHHRNRYAIQQQ